MMDGEMDEAMRAHFPVSFGKQSMPQRQPSVHLTTRRALELTANSSSSIEVNAAVKSSWVGVPKKPTPTATNLEEDGVRNMLPLPSVTGRHETSHDDDGVVIRPPPSSSEKLDVKEEDEEMIGPPRPPQGTSDDGSDSDFDDTLTDDKLRIPLSNEIVLKGHSRLIYYLLLIYWSYNCLMTHIVREAAASCIELILEEDGIRNLLPLPSVTGRHETSHDDDGVVIGPPLPPPSSSEKLDVEEEDEEMIGPPWPPQGTSDDASDSDFDDTLPDDKLRIPLSNEIVLKGHSRIVSALAVDHSGSRVLSGSYDYTVRMYDFQGMTSKLQSFRQLEPFEGHQVRSLSWSPTSDRFLCITGSAQAKIYDRDGLTLGEFIKGDMYIRDLKNTKGHISGLTGGEWNPKSKETILTCSEDGSLRVWDVNDFNSQKQVIKPKLARPMRVPVTACAWDHEGKRIVGAVGDGSIQLWSIKPGWGSRPDIHVERAHTDDVSGLKFSVDGLILLSRSMDSSLKVWDLRQMKNPIKVFDNIPNHYPQTNAAFSPDEQLIFTGTSVEKEDATGGMLCFYDRRKLELVSRVGVSPHQSVVRCTWHPKINQVFATVGDKKEGGTHILYDPSISQRGSLVCVARASRKKSVDDFEAQPIVHNPHALPLFRDQPSRKRQREKILKDPLKSYKPELPVTGPGFGGRVGTTKGSLLTQYLMKQGGLIKETWMEEDPREAILKYADAAAKDPKFIAPAYAETQPKPVFAESDSDDEQK